MMMFDQMLEQAGNYLNAHEYKLTIRQLKKSIKFVKRLRRKRK